MLLEGSDRLAGRFNVWNVGSDGVSNPVLVGFVGVKCCRVDMDAFDRDFNGDLICRFSPLMMLISGLADGGGHYRLYFGGIAIDLKWRNGRTTPINQILSGMLSRPFRPVMDKVLEGSDRLAGRFNVWNVGSDGVIKSGSGCHCESNGVAWLEEVVRDIDNDGIAGIPLVVDANGDGLVDGDGSYRLFRNGDAVDLVTAGGQSLSDQTNPLWNVTRAVVVDDGFNVLVEGTGP